MGPVLYLLYTSPLVDVIRSHGLDYHMYADDNQLYLSLHLFVNGWALMMFHSKFRVPPAVQSLRVGMENVKLSSFAKSLGVTFDDTMSFDNQISKVCKSSFYSLRNISRIHNT